MKMSRLTIIASWGILLLSSIVSAAVIIPEQKFNQKLHNMLPQDIRDKGHIVTVLTGAIPYTIVKNGGHFEGAAIDLNRAVGQLLGIQIIHKSVNGFPAILMGIKSGRYTYESDAVGDFPKREKDFDFIDYVQGHVVFAVRKGNPQQIHGLDSTCGKRIAVMAGGSAERVIRAQSVKCQKSGQVAINIQSYTDQPTSILAVKSERADAYFSSQAPLSYFIKMSNGALELAGIGQPNGFGQLYQGTVVVKGSPLGKVLLACYQELFSNGTYDAILKKWDLTGNRLDQPGINLATASKSNNATE
jgi:polar amino acid transport system substrate-binding protein